MLPSTIFETSPATHDRKHFEMRQHILKQLNIVLQVKRSMQLLLKIGGPSAFYHLWPYLFSSDDLVAIAMPKCPYFKN